MPYVAQRQRIGQPYKAANARNTRMTTPLKSAIAWKPADQASPPLADTRGRALRDLRISVTDRCNFRCTYCMPKEVYGRDFQFLERSQLLSFDEIHRLVKIFRGHGVEKVRITGGEPLVRRQLEKLIAMLAQEPGLDLTLTTNGSLLKQKAQASGQTLNVQESIVDLMKALGMDSSLGARKRLAQQWGYEGALNGSADMNVWLHQQVMQRFIESGGQRPETITV